MNPAEPPPRSDVNPSLGSELSVESLDAVRSHDIIEQATGIIRLLAATDADSAFEWLLRMSREANCSLHDVAVLLTERASLGQLVTADIADGRHRVANANRERRSVNPAPGTTG